MAKSECTTRGQSSLVGPHVAEASAPPSAPRNAGTNADTGADQPREPVPQTEQSEQPAQTGTAVAEAPAPSNSTKPLTPWNVVLLDDDDHTYDYVIRMMRSVFGHMEEKAYQIAKRVDVDGRAVCLTTHKELAELKRDQVLAYGRDPLSATCKGSMGAVIEPAQA